MLMQRQIMKFDSFQVHVILEIKIIHWQNLILRSLPLLKQQTDTGKYSDRFSMILSHYQQQNWQLLVTVVVKSQQYRRIQQFLLNMSEQASNISLESIIQSQIDYSVTKKQSVYVPGEKSGKWTDEQHMKYIVFIDYNKEKMRSKQKRRSNKFYQEMSNFITSRNSLQCRSHHQKLEEKYSHVNKIINIFKNMFDRGIYRSAMDHLDTLKQSKVHNNAQKPVNHKNAETQTEITGVNLEYVSINPSLIFMHPKEYQMPVYPNLQINNNMYNTNMYNLNNDISPITSPTASVMGGVNWWTGYTWMQ